MPRISFKLSELMILLTIIAACLAISVQWPFAGLLLWLSVPPAFVCEILSKQIAQDPYPADPGWRRAAKFFATCVNLPLLALPAIIMGFLVLGISNEILRMKYL